MSQAIAAMSSEEFLVWERGQERKWEFDGVRPVAMTGGSAEHNTIQGNLIIQLRAALRGRPCRPFGPDMRVPTVPGRYRYPDALVTCLPVPRGAVEIAAPVVIFEVLSDGTARIDRTVKATEYCALASVQRYVMVEQDTTLATVVARTETGWSYAVLEAGDTLVMPEIGVEVAMALLYADVELPLPE